MDKIEHYSNYRKFLADFYKEKKKKSPCFSYRYFLKKADIKSPSFLKEVIDGKRNLTARSIKAFSRALGLCKDEASYFDVLVRFNQSDSAQEKKELLVEMYNYVKKVYEYPVPMAYYEYFKNWYNIALKELTCILDWKDNYALLARSLMPPITPEEAGSSVAMLLNFGFIVKNRDGSYSQSYPLQTASEEVKTIGRKELKHQFALLADEAIDRFPKDETDVTFFTFRASPDHIAMIKKEIGEFYDRLKVLMNYSAIDKNKEVDRIYQMNVQVFPLSKKIRRTSDYYPVVLDKKSTT